MDDRLVDDNFFVVTAKPDWYAGIVELFTIQKLPENWTKKKRRKVRINTSYFVVVEHTILRAGYFWPTLFT